MKIKNGVHEILFKAGNLYLDGVKIAGDGVEPKKEVSFVFTVNDPEQKETNTEDPSILKINVHDSIKPKDIGPGQ